MANAKIICYCGHDCARCITYRAAIENNDDLRRKSQKFYRDVFKKDIPLGQIRCAGGRTNGIFHLCKECPWMVCCQSAELTPCSECPEYNCPPLAVYIAKYVNQCNQLK